MAHTPGPWSVCKHGIVPCPCGFIWDASEEIHVASAHGPEDLGQSWYGADVAVSIEEQEANGRLIAAAPELLAALKFFTDRFVAFVESGDAGNFDPETQPEVIKARAAIAKAEGR